MSLAALAGSVNASCVNYRPGPVPLTAADMAGAPRERWTLHAGRIIANPIAVDQYTVYAGGVDRVLHAISLDSGKVRWGFRLSGTIFNGVIRGDSSVYVATVRPEGNVVALRAANGTKRWSTKVGEVAGTPALIGDLILIPTRRGDLVALAATTGALRWRRRIGYSRSGAVAADGGIAVASLDSIFRLAPGDGGVVQRRRAPGPMVVPWVAAGGRLLGATTDSALVALRASDLTTVWRAPLDAPVFAEPAVRNDTAYVATRIGTIYAVAIATGASRRIATLGWPLASGPALYGDLLLVGGADGVVRAIDSAGRVAWRLSVWRPLDVPPLPVPNGLIVVGGNGDFHRYSP